MVAVAQFLLALAVLGPRSWVALVATVEATNHPTNSDSDHRW